MQHLLKISRWIDALNEWVGRLTLGLVLLMVLVGVWNVVGRYIGFALQQNLSSNALIELQWYLFDLVFLLGAAYTLKHGEHVRVDVFYTHWRHQRQALANLIGAIAFLIPFSILVIAMSWKAVLDSWTIREISPDPGGLARYPIKFMLLVSFGLLILQGFSEAIKAIAVVRRGTSPTEEPYEQE